jgi:hypothetical protein
MPVTCQAFHVNHDHFGGGQLPSRLDILFLLRAVVQCMHNRPAPRGAVDAGAVNHNP